MTRGQFVYRFFNEQGIPLYVGGTVDTQPRFAEHRRNSEWWAMVDHDRTDITDCVSFEERCALEESEIRRLQPKYNVAGIDYAYYAPTERFPTGQRPTFTFTVPTKLWRAAQRVARENGDLVATHAVRRALVQYVKENQS